jgi:hypothetical protein
MRVIAISIFGAVFIAGCTTDIYETQVDGIEVKVLFPNGETPVYNASVRIENEETLQVYTTRTDISGFFARTGLSDAIYMIYVESDNGVLIGQIRVNVNLGRSAKGVELKLETRAEGTRIALVEGTYDDIHSVFADLYMPHLTYSVSDLASAGNYASLDILAIESGADLEGDPGFLPETYPNINDFVFGGGTLILSDREYTVLEELWPDKVDFANPVTTGNNNQEINCTVTPSEYVAYLRTGQYNVSYDLPNFAVVENCAGDIYFTGSYETANGPVSDVPVLMAFGYGEGRVIYSNFNWRAQLEDNEYTRRAFGYLITN